MACLSLGLVAATAATAADGQGKLDLVKPRFVEDEITTNEGHATIQWSLPGASDSTEGVVFALQQARDPDFQDQRLRHRGPGQSFFVSGLREGLTYFRVRASRSEAIGPWSDPLVVEVDYPGRGSVILLLAIGCLVFAATVVAIVAGWARHRDSRGEARASA